MLRQLLKRSHAIVGCVHDLRKMTQLPARISDRIRWRSIIRRYFEENEIRKLQIGAGPTVIDGWLSTDIEPRRDNNTIFLDATQVFPFDDNTFDYIYCEHVIEHINWEAALHMLKECKRVLKPSGKVRIATPDLAVLIELYRGESPASKQYIQWITDRFLPGIDEYSSTFVINNAFRNWGHQFIFDDATIRKAMTQAGFVDIEQKPYGESDDEHLKGIESHGDNIGNHAMAVLETMIYEAKCPLQ